MLGQVREMTKEREAQRPCIASSKSSINKRSNPIRLTWRLTREDCCNACRVISQYLVPHLVRCFADVSA
jgi:hypothetical protein